MTQRAQSFFSSGTFTAPPTLIGGGVALQVFGTPGSPSGASPGGLGSRISGVFSLTAGDTLVLTIGYHSGGSGGFAGNGGGSTAVIHSGTLIVEAAGGGGGGQAGNAAFGVGGNVDGPGGSGGAGGVSPGAGAGGQPASVFVVGGGGGQPANAAADGAGGTAAPGNGQAGGGGGGGVGGGGANSAGNGGRGGGGGGGAHGGGGGGSGAYVVEEPTSYAGGGGGGGGGWSFVSSSLTNPVITDGGSEVGAVIVTYTFADPPNVPTLTGPVNAAYVNAAAGLIFGFEANPGTDSGPMNGVALRLKQSGGTYGYWNGTDFTSTHPVFVPVAPGTLTIAIPASKIANGSTYSWSIATQESHYDLQGTFAPDSTFTAVVAPVVNIAVPNPTVFTAQPQVIWSDTLGGGFTQLTYRGVVYNLSDTQQPTFQPGVTPGVYDTGVVSSPVTSFQIGPGLLNTQTYVVYVQVTETGGVPSAWASDTFTIEFDGPAIPIFSALPGADPVTGCPISTLIGNVSPNLLTAVDSSFEAGLGSWAGLACTIAQASGWSQDQDFSLLATATGNGPSAILTPVGASAYPIEPSSEITLMATVKTTPDFIGNAMPGFATFPFTAGEDDSPGVPVTLQANFYDVNGAGISDVVAATGFASPQGTQIFGTITTPFNAAYVSFGILVATATIGQQWWVDETGLFYGSVAAWSIGGFAGAVAMEYEYSDDQGTQVNWFDVRNGTGVEPGDPTIIDYEAPFNQPRYYRARTVSTETGQNVYSDWSPVISTTLVSNRYWFVDPLNPGLSPTGFPGAIPIYRTSSRTGSTASGVRLSHEVDQEEQQGAFQVFGRSATMLVRGDMYDENFDIATWFGSIIDWENFDQLRLRRVTICMRSDMPGKLHYMAAGPARPRDIYSGVSRNKPDSMTEAIITCIPQDKP